jgi:hypothetical protein
LHPSQRLGRGEILAETLLSSLVLCTLALQPSSRPPPPPASGRGRHQDPVRKSQIRKSQYGPQIANLQIATFAEGPQIIKSAKFEDLRFAENVCGPPTFSVCLSVALSVCLSVCIFACHFACLFACLFSVCLLVCLPVCLAVCLAVCLSVCLPVCLPVCFACLCLLV